MSSVDTLPGDQRAVLQLVLGRGRSYDEIARMLSMNPDSVRDRARAALDALGPQTGVAAEDRARIGDYLLGQLPAEEIDHVRGLLAGSPGERAWARVLASELAPLASGSLPEIPVDASAGRPRDTVAPPPPPPSSSETLKPGARLRLPGRGASPDREPGADEGARPRSSRLGGMIVIAGGVIVVIVVLVIILTSGSSTPAPAPAAVASTSSATTSTTSTTSPTTTTTTTTTSSTSSPAAGAGAASASTSTAPAASGTTTTSTTTGAKVLAQVNLTPTAAGSKAAGIAEVLREGTTDGIAIVAQNIPPNSTYPPNAYAVWLYNSPTDAHILGFVNPGVGVNQRLSTAGGLPSNAAHYKQLLVTLETTASPKTPGTVVLQGTLPAL
jgi:hypothetical protein